MKKPKKRRRRLLGDGYPWFSAYGLHNGPHDGYRAVSLFGERHAKGEAIRLRIGPLGAFRRVKLYAEWEE